MGIISLYCSIILLPDRMVSRFYLRPRHTSPYRLSAERNGEVSRFTKSENRQSPGLRIPRTEPSLRSIRRKGRPACPAGSGGGNSMKSRCNTFPSGVHRCILPPMAEGSSRGTREWAGSPVGTLVLLSRRSRCPRILMGTSGVLGCERYSVHNESFSSAQIAARPKLGTSVRRLP